MKSHIFISEAIENKNKKYGAHMQYHPVLVDGKKALFTRYQIDEAILRAERNPEKIPGQTFWDVLLNYVGKKP